ncbi:MAG TPA: alpha/beta hydrolase [Thermomicrobiales bacterium]|nr:alpha/beta hydrolase [Thermomicrobiales bacterium]
MESVCSADGTRIAYQRGGEGPPLVLVHGSADDHTSWAPLLPALRERFTVYALDRRGRGESGAPDTAPYAIEREFEDVAAVVAATGEPANLLGHSYGALCALGAALRAGNLRRLVLYEPPIPAPPGGAIAAPGALAKMEALLAAGDPEGTVLTFAREVARIPEAVIAAERATPAWQKRVATAPTLAREVRAAEGYAFDPARVRGLATPTLLLLGGESPPFLRAATEAIAAALPHSRLAPLAGQGHLAMYSAPDLFLRTVVEFLTAA